MALAPSFWAASKPTTSGSRICEASSIMAIANRFIPSRFRRLFRAVVVPVTMRVSNSRWRMSASRGQSSKLCGSR